MAFQNPFWEVQTGGNDTNNGGGFDTGAGNTFATDGAATSATGTSPVFTSASYNFVAGDVGAWLFIKSGTNWVPGWYKIASVAANAATLDAAIGHVPLFLSVNANSIQGVNTAAGCATTASPTSATWSVDYSQGTGITFTDAVIGGTNTQFTSAAHPVGKNFVGNIIKWTSGTGWTVQRVRVISTSGTTATCDVALGTAASTGGNGAMGPLASLGFAGSVVVAGPGSAVFVKSGSYSVTSASTNVAAGCLSLTVACDVIGYQTIRGDFGTAPILTASGIATTTIIKNTNQNCRVGNFTVDGASLTSIRCFDVAGPIIYCTAKNATNSGFNIGSTGGQCYSCYATGCGTAGSGFIGGSNIVFYGCEALANTVVGFSVTSGVLMSCISSNNTGASTDGISVTGTPSSVIDCIVYGNGRDGIRSAAATNTILNCIAETNVGWGINNTQTTNAACIIDYCATFNNNTGGGTGAINTANDSISPKGKNITYTSTAFVNAASNNFQLNTNPNGGGALLNAGWPGTYQSTNTKGNKSPGGVQPPVNPGGFFIG